MRLRTCLWDVVPFTGMVLMEGCTVGLTIMAKTAMARGMSHFVFVLYSNALASLILLPSSFIFYRITIAQNLAFTGLSYSSPILACGMGNLIPAFSFILSIILRMGKVDLRKSSSQAKTFGTLISIMGAIMVIVYKGPAIRRASSPSHSNQLRVSPPFLLYSSTPENWVLGGLLLAAASLSVSIWNIIQAGTVKEYPEVMTVLSFYSLFGTIQCAVVSIIAERDLTAWKLKLDMELVVIVLTAVFGSVIRSSVQVWCMRMKGPVYVAMFKPLTIVMAVIAGIIFFGDSLHFGSVVGAFIVGMGYYGVMWGQIREEEMKEDSGDHSLGSSSTQKVPLLENEVEV
ncbi:hypothetical protein HHK36_015160 [Tetracentron sinense]|uniref:WAT1-related protein n=1 Tax=Tetracentron sinense TaxID=13715 RepID=A0A834Z4F5_TETSI|nr:hypothetical protein HHK36_015160 [Tetracentron sinense]